MQFALFLLLNAVLILRPEELFPAITGIRLYLITLIACGVVSIPELESYFRSRPLRERPVVVCVLGFYGATVLSLILRGKIGAGMECMVGFGKDMFYFLLLVATITTVERLKLFLSVLAVLFLGQVVVALLNHHEIIVFERIILAPHRELLPTGELTSYNRMTGSGIYNDPNDLCLCIGSTMVLCFYGFFASGNPLVRLLWLTPLPLLAHALAETHSRGGLLGLAAGVMAYLYGKFGSVRMLPVAAVVMGGLLTVAGGGRQTDFKMGGNDTSNHRLQLWDEGFQAMASGPVSLLVGIGYDRYADEVGMVAHNSFVHAYVESGFVGGSLFLSAFVLSCWLISRAGRSEWVKSHPDLLALYPCMLALVVGYVAGCYSLSRQYIGPTYLILGLASVYIDLALSKDPIMRGRGLPTRIAIIGLVGYVVIRTMCILLVRY